MCSTKQRDVSLSIAQRRQVNVKDVQAKIEILAKLALCHSLFRILVRCGEHAHVHRRFHLAAEAAYLVVLEHAQQLRLRRSRHLANFIEQQRAAIGKFEAAEAAFRGAREGPALVPKNFTFHQGLWNGRTIDGDEGPLRARGEPVNGSRQDFLARTGFSRD
jgi:hypothetical protein